MASDLYTREVEGITRKCLPVEDFEEGLYIHPGSAVVVSISSLGSASLPEEPEFLVGALDFMLMQKERDELRKTLGFLNVECRGWGSIPTLNIGRMHALLDRAGFTADAAKALKGILDWARAEPKT